MMIAVSIIGGRALAPISSAVAQWASLINAREAYSRLKRFHEKYPVEPKRLPLPAPKGRIEVRNLQATPPGASQPSLRNVSFILEAGESVGVIGRSAAGKSTLARVMVGLWQPGYGSVRLDGADLRMWNREQLGPRIGYLPQTIELFDGTVAQNISRFYPDATPESIFHAAERMGVHEMIVDLPDGYNFRVGEGGSRLSAGQRQRIGLARAVYGDPVLVVLDEPNANLDVLGEAALQRGLKSLKEAGTTVVLITHRPSGIEVMDRILVLEKGEVRAFGEKSQVLQFLTKKVAPPTAAAQVTSESPGKQEA
jgi:PrtD family type I secretion system ABC transporter